MEPIFTNDQTNNPESPYKRKKLKESTKTIRASFLDQEITILSKFLKNNPNCERRDVEVDDQKFFDILVHILDRYERKINQIEIIKLFLKSLSNFMKMIRSIQHIKEFDYILTQISHNLKREHFKENELIFRTGDKGDKFYIILKGRVAIIVASPKTVKMNIKDYIDYLIRLKKENEFLILSNTINANKHIYKVTEEYLNRIISDKRSNSYFMSSNISNEKNLLNDYGSELENENNKKIQKDIETVNKRMTVEEYLKKLTPIEIKPNIIEDSSVSNYNSNLSEKKEEFLVNKSFNKNKTIFPHEDKTSKINLYVNNIPNKEESTKKIKNHNTFRFQFKSSGTAKQIKTTSKPDIRHHLTSYKELENSLDSINELEESVNKIKDSYQDLYGDNDDRNKIRKFNTNIPSILGKYKNKINTSVLRFNSNNLIKNTTNKFPFNTVNSSEASNDNSDKSNKQGESAEIIVWEYNHILTLEKGDTFGELALESISSKRTATLITLEDCNCGVLTQQVYEECLKDTNEKANKNNIHYILNNTIFHGCEKVNFPKKQFNYFTNIKLKQGEMLIEENKSAEFIYFIKDGEYQVETSRSLIEVNSFIKNLGGNPYSKNEDGVFYNPQFEKFYNKKFKIKISILKDKDVIGLSDYEFDSKYIFNVKLISVHGEAFKIEKKFYDTICNSDKAILENSEKFIAQRKKLLRENLIRIKEIKIAMFKDFSKNKINSSSGSKSFSEIEFKNNFGYFNISSRMENIQTSEKEEKVLNSNDNLKFASSSSNKFLGNRERHGNFASTSADLSFPKISKFSIENSAEKTKPIFNLKKLKEKNSSNYSSINTKNLFSDKTTPSKFISPNNTPFSNSHIEVNEFSPLSLKRRSKSITQNNFINENYDFNSIFKSKMKILTPGVLKRVLIPKTEKLSEDRTFKLKNNRKICEVKSKINGISELNPLLISENKKIFYNLMDEIRILKPSEEINSSKTKEEKSSKTADSKYQFNFIDCLVVDKIVERKNIENSGFSHKNEGAINRTLGNFSSVDFNKTKFKIKSKSIFKKNPSPFKNNINFNLKENFSKAKIEEENTPKIYSKLMKFSE